MSEEGNNIDNKMFKNVSCNYHNGVYRFGKNFQNMHEGMDAHIHDDVSIIENTHFWYVTRSSFLIDVLLESFQKSDEIIEIGAGTGYILKLLKEKGFKSLYGSEVNETPLQYLRKLNIEAILQFDLQESRFEDLFDGVLLLDVLEHIDNDELAINKIHSMLKPGGKMLVTVPSHQWLWSSDDEVASHRRRYELSGLEKMILRNNFKILKSTCFFSCVTPLYVLRSWISRRKPGKSSRDRFKINILINKILIFLLTIENFLISYLELRLPFGGSIMILAEKE